MEHYDGDDCPATRLGHWACTKAGRVFCTACQQYLEGAFEMDGTLHTMGDPECCRREGFCECGGKWHYQPVYGGYYRECDRCHQRQ